MSYESDIGFKNSQIWNEEFTDRMEFLKAKNITLIADDLTASAFAAGMVLTVTCTHVI